MPRRVQYDIEVKPIASPGVTEVVTTEKWQTACVIPQRNWSAARAWSVAAIAPFLAFQLTTTQQPERITPDKWQLETNRPRFDIKREQWRYPCDWIDATQLTLHERITPDKWQPDTNKPLFDLKREQYVYPSYMGLPLLPVDQIRTESWYRETEKPRWDVQRRQWLYPPFTYDTFQFTRPEATTVDRWQPETNRPRWDIARRQFLYPYLFIDPFALTKPELVSVDRWQPETNRPRWDVRRQQHTYLFTVNDTLIFVNPGVETCNLYGSPFLFTQANWDATVTFYLEAYARAVVGEIKVKLYDVTAGAVVTDSTVTSSVGTLTRIRSGAITLVDGHTYQVQFCVTGGSVGGFKSARIIGIG